MREKWISAPRSDIYDPKGRLWEDVAEELQEKLSDAEYNVTRLTNKLEFISIHAKIAIEGEMKWI